MAYSVNKVTLLGNVGKDPEIKTFQNGGKVASFSLATSESWKDKTSGEKKTSTEWHNIVVKNDGLVGVIEKYVKKGAKLHIEGKLETRTYEKDGSKRYITEIVLYPYSGEIVLLDAKDAPTDAPPTE
jgi:single-strand DNA-binding protein